MMRKFLSAALIALLAACSGPGYDLTVYGPGGGAPSAPRPAPSAPSGPGPAPLPDPGPGRPGTLSKRDFVAVASRIEPAAERFCRQAAPQRPARDCDFVIRLVDDPRVGPNAFQTIGRDGRPLIVFTVALLREAGSRDEVAFVLAHEAGHQIADHLTRVQRDQMLGALILGGLAAATGTASEQGMAEAMDLGAFLGSRAYSQNYELEADVLGAYVAARAGYDPERGAKLFMRPALRNSGGPTLLATHPPSAKRAQVVSDTVWEIRRQQAAGLEPSPANVKRRTGS